VKKLTLWLWLFWILCLSYSCATVPNVQYENVKANTIVVFDGVTSWTYNIDEWMVVKRTTYQQVWDLLSDKDEQLNECLEREKAKTK